MPTETFNFCPERNVPETLPREGAQPFTTGSGWQFTSRPTSPYQKRFRVKLYGLKWYLQAGGLFDTATDPNFNARALEQFYERHELWKPFNFAHQHFGTLLVRFNAPLTIPAGTPNSGGRIGDAVEMQLIHHNPSFS